MPQYSVVVPVHDVEGYLGECLESVLGQSYGDLEVVVVDDASTDGSRDILGQYAKRDPRVRVVWFEVNRGLASARNAGLDRATGDYVLFLDSDDWLHPEALALIDRQLGAGDADLLVFDFARVSWQGSARPHPNVERLRSMRGEVFSLRDRPELLRVVPVAVNKAYRRTFLEEHSLRFPDGLYEDTPWTYRALLLAEKITVLDDVLYYYRQRRRGSILRTVSPDHFEIFDQWDRLYDFLDERSELEEFRGLLFDEMVAHLLTILRRGEGRIPRPQVRVFFEHAHQVYRDRCPRGHTATVPAAKTSELEALARGSFRALKRAQRRAEAEPSAHGGRSWARDTARDVIQTLRRWRYRAYRRETLDPELIVLGGPSLLAYRGDAAALYERAATGILGLRPVWVQRGAHLRELPEEVNAVAVGTVDYYRALARASFIALEDELPSDFVKRPGQTFLRLHPHQPFASMGVNRLQHAAAGGVGSARRAVKRADDWDLVLAAGVRLRAALKGAYPSNLDVAATGHPRNDRLHAPTSERVRHARRRLGLPKDGRVVLYAPVNRAYWPDHRLPASPSKICAALPEDTTLLTFAAVNELHHVELRRLRDEGRLLSAPESADATVLSLAADLLITDYSPLLLDYIHLDRPVVIHAPDWATYCHVYGPYVDPVATPPGVLVKDEENLYAVLADGRYDEPEHREQRRQFREAFTEHDDGRASERVLRLLIGEPLPAAEVGATTTILTTTTDP